MTNETTNEATAKAKYDSLDKVPARTIFESIETAFSEVQDIMASVEDSDNVELVFNGMDSDGNVNQEAWPEGSRVMVTKLASKQQTGVDKDTQKAIYGNVPYAIVCWPVPTLSQLMADTDGAAMVESSMLTELCHRIVRPIRRDKDNQDIPLLDLASGMATTIAELANLTRSSGGGKLAPYDSLYKVFTDKLKSINPLFAKSKMSKGEFRKCLESKAYADHYYASLEDAKIFAISLQALPALAAKADPVLDGGLFTGWAADRENKQFDIKEDDLSFDSLFAAFDEPEAGDTPTESEPEQEAAE